MRICESCGMPMEGAKDHGGQDEKNIYCKHCTDSKGQLKSREQVREGMINYMMRSEKKERAVAEKLIDEHMSRMPVWKGS